jgi:hypothetical protein
MNGQLLLVALIVIGALLFVGRTAWRSLAAARAPKSGCGSDCGCGH